MSINRRLLLLSFMFLSALLFASTANAEETPNPPTENSRVNQPEPNRTGFDPGPVDRVTPGSDLERRGLIPVPLGDTPPGGKTGPSPAPNSGSRPGTSEFEKKGLIPVPEGIDQNRIGNNVNRGSDQNKMPPSFSNQNPNDKQNFGRPQFGQEMKNEKGMFTENNFGNQKNGQPNFGNNEMGPMGNPGMNKNMNSENNRGNFNMNMNSEQGNMMRNQDMNSEENQAMNEKREAERQAQQEKQMVQNVQRQIKGMEQGLKQFDRQLVALTKQGVIVPAEISASLAKIKSTIAGVKAAKTEEDLTAAGWEDLFEEMNTLRESQQLLQQLSHWPQTLKQIDRQLANFNRELKKSKTIADRLQKKGLNVAELYSSMESALAALKTAREEAVALVAAGKIEDAYTLLEEKFFGGAEDMMETQRVLQTMNNIRQFPTQFKKINKHMDQMIARLKRKKVDTAELEQLKAGIVVKSNEVAELMKSSKLDVEALMESLQDLENAGQEFMEMAESLLGESEPMPWEQNNGNKSNFSLPDFNSQL